MLYMGTAPSCLIWRGFVGYSCIAVWLPDSKRKHYLSIELFTLKEIPGVSTWLLSDLKRICWVFMHGCLTPWLKEEALPVYWAVHTEGDPWREYLIVVGLEEDLLHAHALLSDLLARFATRLLSCSVTCLWLSEEESLCEPLTSVCSVICLRLSEEESLWESLSSVCSITLLVSAPLLASGCPKRNRCANPLPVSAPLFISGCPKRNRCANPLPVSASLLTSVCRRGTAVWTSYAAWRRRESDQPLLFSLGFSLF